MNISPATLKRWQDQLHLLAPPDAAKMRELAEHGVRPYLWRAEPKLT
jgi:hypothetical protein